MRTIHYRIIIGYEIKWGESQGTLILSKSSHIALTAAIRRILAGALNDVRL